MRCRHWLLGSGRIVLLLGPMLLAMLALATPSHGAAGDAVRFGPMESPRTSWVTDGAVYDQQLSTDGRTLYVGGWFDYAGRMNGSGVSLDATSGAALGDGAILNGTVAAVVSDGSGGWYVGGSFTRAGDWERRGLVHLLADGSVDPAWNPTTNGQVTALALDSGVLYVGGIFTTVGAQARSYLAAVDAATGTVTPWNPGAGSTVYALAVSGSTVYVGGNFTTLGGQARNYIGAVATGTGTLAAWNPNASATVHTLLADGATLYAGGTFATIGGQARANLAALDAGTGAPTAWSPAPSSSVRALVRIGGTMYVGGQFTTIAGQARNRLAAFDMSTGVLGAWNPSATNAVYAMAASGSTIYVGGAFTSVGGQSRTRIAALDAGTGLATSWDPGASASVDAIAVGATRAFIGGQFASAGGERRSNLAAFDYEGGNLMSWNPGTNGIVYDLALSGSSLIVGGSFSTIAGTSRPFLASVDAGTGSLRAWNPVVNGVVRRAVMYAGSLYVAGDFTTVGGQSRGRLAAVDPASGAVGAWNPGADASVSTIAEGSGMFYVGGDFTMVGGQARNRLAAIAPGTGTVGPWNPGADATVHTIAVEGATVYVGGDFTVAGGQGRARIAAIDASAGTATSWNPGASSTVRALATSGVDVYAAGSFTTLGGQSRSYLGAVDSRTGIATAWAPQANFVANSVQVTATNVLVGGSFRAIGTTLRSGFAIFPRRTMDSAYGVVKATTLSADEKRLFVGGDIQGVGVSTGGFARIDSSGTRDGAWPVVVGTVKSVVPDSRGGWYIGGSFSRVGDSARRNLAHVLPDGSVDPAFDPSPNYSVESMDLLATTLYVGGNFSTIGGRSQSGLAALDATTGIATSWSPAATIVFDLDATPTAIYIAGNFSTIGGQARGRIAAIDPASGAPTSWYPGPADQQVDTIRVHNDIVYFGGNFSSVAGQPRSRLASADATTGALTSWDPGANNMVRDIEGDGGLVYVAGAFTTVGGQARWGAAALDASTGAATAWNPGVTSGSVSTIAISGATTYLGGSFTTIAGSSRLRLAAVSTSTAALAAWNPSASDTVWSIAIRGDTVHAGGEFASLNGQARSNAASFDTESGVATTWAPALNGFVNAMVRDGGTIFVGGDFSSVGATSRTRLAAFDAATGALTAWSGGVTGTVNALAVRGTQLYVGGIFTTASGNSRNRLASFDTTTAAVSSFHPDVDNTVSALAFHGDTLYLGGSFSTVGGQARARLAAVDVTTGALSSWNPGADNSVLTLAASTERLYAGGWFVNIGGQARRSFATFDLPSGNLRAWNPVNTGNYVAAITLRDDSVYVGGSFFTSRTHLVAYDVLSGAVLPLNAELPELVNGIAVGARRLYAGGAFGSFGRAAGSIGVTDRGVDPPASVGDGSAGPADADGWSQTTAFDGWWSAVSHPELQSYEYCVTTSPTGTDCQSGATVTWTTAPVGTTSFSRSGLSLANGALYHTCVRSVATDASQSMARCSDGARVDTQPPAVALVAPADAATVSTTALSAAYSDPAPATTGSIDFQVCADSACATVLESGSASGLVTGATGTWSHARVSGSYWWRARATDEGGSTSPWSAARSFTLTRPPATPGLVSPPAGGWVATATPSLMASFTDPDGGTGRNTFELCQSDPGEPWASTCASGFQSVTSAAVASGTNASVQPTTPLADGSWYWRARSVDPGGSTSAPSASRLLRIDTRAPSLLFGQISRAGLGRVQVTWPAASDVGVGGVTYDVTWSGDGSSWAAVCTDVTILVCEQNGLGGTSLPFLRVRACDALDNCTTWQGRLGGSATGYYLRTTVESAPLTGTADKRATLASGTANILTQQRVDAGETGWYQLRPGVLNSANPVATEPGGAPTGNYGWLIEESAGKSIARGTWTVTITTDSDSDGVARMQCRAWIVTVTGGTISASTQYQSGYTDAADVFEPGERTHTCVLPGVTTQFDLAANQFAYVELYLHATAAPSSNNKRLNLSAEGTGSAIAIPPPGTAPSMPTIVAPADGEMRDAVPTIQATYLHPAGTQGALEYEFATDPAFTSLVHTGTSALVAAGTTTSTATQALPGGMLYWRVRGHDTSDLVSAWTPTRVLHVSSPPARPVNQSPTDVGSTTDTTPDLTASAFSDPNSVVGDSHAGSQFQIAMQGYDWSTGQDSGLRPAGVTWTVGTALATSTSWVWRVRYVDAYGQWSEWSAPTSFTVASTPSLTLSLSTTNLAFGQVAPGSDRFGTIVATAGTANPNGLSLQIAGTASGADGMACGGCVSPIRDWAGTTSAPTAWPSSSVGTGYLGATVRDAPGGRDARWGTGTGTIESDVVANRYAGIGTTPSTVHATTSASPSVPVTLTLRVAPGTQTSPGSHSETLTLTVTANP